MSVIDDALRKLENAVDKLEGSASLAESRLKGQQRDMFDDPNIVQINKGKVVQRIDSAIERVENLLEGEQ